MSEAYVVEAEVDLASGTDPAAVGAAVTVELCGHWEHDGPCRWPHNSDIDASRSPAVLRTIYVADPDEQQAVRGRIEQALGASSEWSVVDFRERDVADGERELAGRLRSGPRRERA